MNSTEDQINIAVMEVPKASDPRNLEKNILRFWDHLAVQSVNYKIFRAFLTVGLLTGFAKILVLIKEMFCAAWFGIGDGLDAFLIAFLIPTFILSVVQGAIIATVVPIFSRIRTIDGERASDELLAQLTSMSFLLTAILAILLAATSGLWLKVIASGFSEEKLALAQLLLLIMLPGFVIDSIGSVWQSVLNARERFSLPSTAPALVPACIVLTLIISGDRQSVVPLAIGTVIGQCLATILLGWGLIREGSKLRFCLPRVNFHTRNIISQFLPLLGASALYASGIIVDQSMAAMLSPGSVSALNFASKVPLVFIAFSSAALGTAVIPYFSQQIAMGDIEGIRQTFNFYTKIIIIISVPATIALFFLSHEIVSIMFQRGAFTEVDSATVSWIAAMYSLQMPFYFLALLGMRFLWASLRNTEVLLINLLTTTVNIILNFALINLMGVAGIALSTSIVYLVCAATVYAVIYGRNFQFPKKTKEPGNRVGPVSFPSV
jgi:putative peptidoglycan lipid II flippase